MGIKYDSIPIEIMHEIIIMHIMHEIIHLNIKIIELKKKSMKNILRYYK